MRVDLLINGTSAPAARYVGWTPAPCLVMLRDGSGSIAPVRVRLKNLDVTGGQIVFREPVSLRWRDTLEVELPPDGGRVAFSLAGKFGFPSIHDRDAAIEVVDVQTSEVLCIARLMVRVRKDVNALSNPERDRLLHALAKLNAEGTGPFKAFREMHTKESDRQMHTLPGFLPWHRAYLLDLERELQAICPAVTIPYWRFDRPAPALFTREFMGAPDGRLARFHPMNPLDHWTTDLERGIRRYELGGHRIADECETLFDDNPQATFERFRRMERGPHAAIHASFEPFLGFLPEAARDPAFFLLHCNVDRLWAKWQWVNGRFDSSDKNSYDQSVSGVGHRLTDSLWPWNQLTGSGRPRTAPGGRFASSALTLAPGSEPKLRDMFDYQGLISQGNRLGFDYDDVPYQPDVGSVHDYRAEFIQKGPCSQRTSSRTVRYLDLNAARIALGLLKNDSAPVEERRRAFGELVAAEVSLNSFAEIEAEFRSTLRYLIDDRDEQIRLRAIHILAATKDDVVQSRLLAGLQGDEPLLLSVEDAVLMLTYDVHASHFELLRHLAWTSPDPRVREAAIRALSQDPSSAPRLHDAMTDRVEPVDIRRSAALSLRDLDGNQFRESAAAIVLDDTEDDDLRVSLAVSLELMDAPELLDSQLQEVVRHLIRPAGG
jgi:tyrosinase